MPSSQEEPPLKRHKEDVKDVESDDDSSDDAPAPVAVRPPEFDIKLDMKDAKGLGLDVDWGDGKTLYIKGVKAEGAVTNWNRTCAAHLVVESGDRIIAINEKEGNPKAMLAECRTKSLLSLTVRTSAEVVRPVTFAISVDIGKAGLGLDVDWSDGRTLFVKNVKVEGAIADWNKSAKPHEVIQTGDRVVKINDAGGDPKAMLAECKARQRLKLHIRTDMPNMDTSKKDQKAVAAASAKGQVPKCYEFTVLVDMTRQNILGLDVDWSDGKTLYINSVQPGAIQDWNLVNPVHRQVCAGDRIVSVNGYSDDPEAMASLCKELSMAQCAFEVKVRGPPPMPKGEPAPPERQSDKKDKGDKREKERERDRRRDRSDD